MSVQSMFVAIFVLCVILAGLFVFILCTKIAQVLEKKRRIKYSLKIKPNLECILENQDYWYKSYYMNYIRVNRLRIKKKQYRKKLESILLEYLEDPKHPHWQRVLDISYDLGYPSLCLPLIQSRNHRKIAIGCRKAGLYKYTEALPYMRNALKIFTGETQFQILMGISRIGDVDAMQHAFDDISRYVMLNERAAFQILSVFSGDKRELYKRMIHCGEDYVVSLFLKSLDADTAKTLSEDIMEIFNDAGKETRIAAMRAINITDKSKYSSQLINALNDVDWEVRAMAAKSLSSVPSTDAGVALSKLLNDPEWWVRQNAAFSIISYPNCEELCLDIIKTKDTYAQDSIVYVLEATGRLDILAVIQQALAEMEADKEDENKHDFLNEYHTVDAITVK